MEDRSPAKGDGRAVELKVGTHRITATRLRARVICLCRGGRTIARAASSVTGLRVDGWPVERTGDPDQVVELDSGLVLVVDSRAAFDTSATASALELRVADGTDLVVCSAHAAANRGPSEECRIAGDLLPVGGAVEGRELHAGPATGRRGVGATGFEVRAGHRRVLRATVGVTASEATYEVETGEVAVGGAGRTRMGVWSSAGLVEQAFLQGGSLSIPTVVDATRTPPAG